MCIATTGARLATSLRARADKGLLMKATAKSLLNLIGGGGGEVAKRLSHLSIVRSHCSDAECNGNCGNLLLAAEEKSLFGRAKAVCGRSLQRAVRRAEKSKTSNDDCSSSRPLQSLEALSVCLRAPFTFASSDRLGGICDDEDAKEVNNKLV